MWKLFQFLKPYKWYVILSPLCMLLEVFLQLLQPRFMKVIIDDGVAQGDFHVIWKVCALMLGTSFLAVFGGVGCTVFSTLTGQCFGTDLREKLFSRVLELSFAETDRFQAASLITRLTDDVNRTRHFVVMLLRMLVRQPLMCIGGCIMALTLDVRLALILFLMIPPVVGLALLSFKISRPLFAKIQKKTDQLNAVIRENLAGLRVVKAFHRGDYELERFCDTSRSLADQQITASKIMSSIMPFTMCFMNMAILLVLYIGGLSIRNGNMTTGEVMAMLNYIMEILFSFLSIAFFLNDFARAKVSADRVCEVLNTQSSVSDKGTEVPVQHGPASLEFRDVTFQYPGAAGTPILQGLSFELKPGQKIAVLGATGSGKSTIAHLIPRFYDCTSGAILLDGKDIRSYTLTSLRDSIAIVLQDAVLFSGSIQENIRWGRREASDAEVQEAATTAQASSFIEHFDEKYNTIVGQRGVTLSGGQKQRLAIARALLKRPRLLILDDCASALDLATEQNLHKALAEDFSHTTVLLIAQRVSSVRNADAILILSDGHAVGFGTHEQLLRSCQVYREIVASQTGEDIKGGNINA